MTAEGSRLAVVLFNLGGPDGPASVRPFLRNLFSDPAIIRAPGWVRRPLAATIARARETKAVANYAVMGGGSPLLAQTLDQAKALERLLESRAAGVVKVFVAMRHWRPDTAEAVTAVTAFAPDALVLAPLYPQFSTTTTGSSLAAWAAAWGERLPSRAICCWWDSAGLARAHADLIGETWDKAGRPPVRLLFSAHGLPEAVVKRGDPYQWQVEATCAKVAALLGRQWDFRICYQSRVGPMKWLGPTTPEAIAEAARDGVGVLVDPIAFVSEHIETLVELDRDYADLAESLGVKPYLRVPAVSCAPSLIAGLADAVEAALGHPGVAPGGRGCPRGWPLCPRTAAAPCS